MNFELTSEQQWLQGKCRALAADFATRAAAHDRDASHPVENYRAAARGRFPRADYRQGMGRRGVPACSTTRSPTRRWGRAAHRPRSPLTCTPRSSCRCWKAPRLRRETKRRLADLVVRERKLIAGNFSEPVTTSLIGERPLKTRARRVEGGYCITGRKMFASMLEAADYVLVMAYPDGATSPSAGIIFLLPRGAEGRRVETNWDVLGMRATRSDSLILEECFVPDSAVDACALTTCGCSARPI